VPQRADLFQQGPAGSRVGLFHESLCHRGFLVLGSKESVDFSAYSDRFEPLVKQERIYRKSTAACARW
jgi:chemotaxis protein methyltransferase CheR